MTKFLTIPILLAALGTCGEDPCLDADPRDQWDTCEFSCEEVDAGTWYRGECFGGAP